MRNNIILTKMTVLVTAILLLATLAFAGTTGKISGTVKDSVSGDPLPGVNVVIDGTSMGAATNINGQYFILGISPGVYNVSAMMMGYKKVTNQEVRVSIDMTSTINFSLEEAALEGEEVTIVAERPLVKKDMTSSLASVGAKEIEAMPVQSVRDVIGLQAGIVDAGGIHIRGGRSGEVAYWVDGVATTDVYNGNAVTNVENAAVQELQVISGTFNAEYGQAMSGIINIITKDGDPVYHGQVKGYVGDYYSTDKDLYNVLKEVNTITDPETGETSIEAVDENPLEKFNPIYNLEASLSGPVPGFGDKLTFFTNGRFRQSEGYLYGRDWFKPQGIPGDSSLVAMNPSENYSLLGKLTFKPTSNLKIMFRYDMQNTHRDITGFNRNYKYVPYGRPQSNYTANNQLLSINHIISPTTFHELKLARTYNHYEQFLYEDTDARPHWLVYVPEDSTHPEMLFDPETEEGKVILDEVRFNEWDFDYIVDPENYDGYVAADSAQAPAAYSYYRAGNDLYRNDRSTEYYLAKWDLTSQLSQTHQLKMGAEFRSYELSLDSYSLRPALKEDADEQIVPFKPAIPEETSFYRDKYTRNPYEFSGYIQDKMEFQDIILNVGLRFDYFNANHVMITDKMDPNIYNPYSDEFIYKNPGAAEEDLIEYTPDERRDFMHTKVDPKMQISPRLGIAYPITDRGVIHFSYGHFFQIPEFQHLYSQPDFKLPTGGGTTLMGNADLHAQKTVQYEIGLQQQISDDIGIDVTMFYRDVRDWVGTSPVIQTYQSTTLYSQYENKDYENVRGITFKMEKRYTNSLAFKLDYMLQWAEGTYSNPNDAFSDYNAEREPRKSLIPMNWDQRHTLSGQLIYSLKGYTASLIGRYNSGLPYTPSFAKGARVGGTALSGLVQNSARRPNKSSVDFYLTKAFRVNNLRLEAFCYVYNLLDQRSVNSVFADTGSPYYTTYPRLEEVSFDPDRIGTAEDLYTRPEMFISPRQIQLGFSVGF